MSNLRKHPDLVKELEKLRLQNLTTRILQLEKKNAELRQYKRFYDHIKAHLTEMGHPDYEVQCKICQQTFAQITAKPEGSK